MKRLTGHHKGTSFKAVEKENSISQKQLDFCIFSERRQDINMSTQQIYEVSTVNELLGVALHSIKLISIVSSKS